MGFFLCEVIPQESKNKIQVICTSDFAGKTISCTNGTDTYTSICSSSAPYKALFEDLDDGNWTVSCTISSQTYSTTITLPYEQEFTVPKIIKITAMFVSAANDTISFTDAVGSKTVVTNNEGYGIGEIEIVASPTNITFTSSIAKSSSNVSTAYSKTISVSSSTDTVYVMPDTVYYWYGYENKNISWVNDGITITKYANYMRLFAGYGVNNIYYRTSANQNLNGKSIKTHIKSATLGAYSDNAIISLNVNTQEIWRVYTGAVSNTIKSGTANNNGAIKILVQGGWYSATFDMYALYV